MLDSVSVNLFSFKVTSFSALHWVPDHPAVVKFVNEVLCPGGKFLFLVSFFFSTFVWNDSIFEKKKYLKTNDLT